MGEVRIVAEGIAMGESPRWHGGRIWFADWLAGEVVAVDPEAGTREVVVRHSSLPLCFDFLPAGSPVLVSSTERALLRVGPDGRLERYAELAGHADHPWNDIVV